MELDIRQLLIIERALSHYWEYLAMQIDFEKQYGVDKKTLDNLHQELYKVNRLQQDVNAEILRD